MTKRQGLLQDKLRWAVLCIVVICVSYANARAQSATFTAQSHPSLGNNQVAADFNGDGNLDLAGTRANSVAVMLGKGDGAFQSIGEFPVGGQAQDIAAGDFNKDGNTDLVVTINTPQISLSLLKGKGNGKFDAPVNHPNVSGFDSPSIAASDLNGDGNLDVVIAHQISCFTAPCNVARTISVMLGNGDATFQPSQEVDVGTGMSRIVVGDFNHDGLKDLGIAGDSAQVYILNGNGDGTFIQQPTIRLIVGNAIGVDATDIDIADFNRDMIQDLVVAIGLNGSRTAILIGKGDGTFQQPTIITDRTLSTPQFLAVADYNRDGFQDIALAMGDGTRGLMQILHGNGDGTFQPPLHYLVPPPRSSISGGSLMSADFNKDGRTDIALPVIGASPALNILINSTGTTFTQPAMVSSLSLNPSAVTGGGGATGTVTLSENVQTPTTVQLTSSSAAATIPASVTVAAGTSAANFNVNTSQVSSTTSATITATLNGTSRSATLTINSATQAVDTVAVTRAEYVSSKRALRVEATSTRSNATLQVFITSSNQLIGTLTNNGGGRYGGQFNLSVNPQSITVRSSFGGEATRAVTLK